MKFSHQLNEDAPVSLLPQAPLTVERGGEKALFVKMAGKAEKLRLEDKEGNQTAFLCGLFWSRGWGKGKIYNVG